ncbi:MAG: Uma2 family endonuclease [Microcoleus sp. CSU_2_2]|nr:Uma2 family endonuclease [Microcoleus sp. SU_5_3]NJS11813.1 Uma2 family endonuclease [Microcoleus sp. CSU_2_2]
MSLTVKDLEKVQAEHPEWRLELIQGNIIARGPCDYTSDEIGSRLIILLGIWVLPRKLGRLTGSSAGFILPNSDLRAPDVSFVKAEKLKRSRRDFVELVPDLMVEIKSKTDRIKPIKEKIQSFLSLGTEVGILIDPDRLTVTVYRTAAEPEVLRDGLNSLLQTIEKNLHS